jgi:hypothetical protein
MPSSLKTPTIVAPRSASRRASASTRCLRVSIGTARPPLTWTSRWSRFLTVLSRGQSNGVMLISLPAAQPPGRPHSLAAPVVIALLQLEAINRWRYYLADRSNEELAELITSLTEPGPSPEPDDSVDNDSVDNDARKGTAPIPRPPPPPPGPIGIVDFEFSMSTKSRGLNGSLNVRYTRISCPWICP